ncbi:phosphatidylserine synthase [Scheffersomyces xylosifermentans]|uniref:phosphatidylserine synthase n=1 Tax=Scheffersomyces xylosifermentans TaxID=1304137 RepID=UPI00315C9B40
MSAVTSSFKKNESAIVSDSEIDISSDKGVSDIPIPNPPIRRSSSLFSLTSKDLLPKPDEKEYAAFIDDTRHFSLIRNLHMADFITLLNGFSGFYSIISCLRFTLTGKSHYVQRAHFFICLGLFFDFFDGRVARLRNKSSLMGQELDSLADLISFGVSPATIAFAIGFQTTVDVLFLTFWVLCGLTRLARFNISANKIPKDSHGKSQYFEGFPIPTNLLWVFFMAILVYKDWILDQLPGGLLFQDTFFEFHIISIGFFLQGCAEISKSLHIPKP